MTSGEFGYRAGRRAPGARRKSRRGAALLALVAYIFTGAIVPAGHMAAAVASGTPFHLCPGDLRSAQILAVVVGGGGGEEGHHGAHGHGVGHHGGPAQNADSPDTPSAEQTSAEPGCIFAGTASPGLAGDIGQFDLEQAEADALPLRPLTGPRRVAWLRPPVRSPPG